MCQYALEVHPLMLFQLAGYIPVEEHEHSVRAQYLADVFDRLPPEKKDAVMSVLQAMAESPEEQFRIQDMWGWTIEVFEWDYPNAMRDIANQLIAEYNITKPSDIDRLSPDIKIGNFKLRDLPRDKWRELNELIHHKVALDPGTTWTQEDWKA